MQSMTAATIDLAFNVTIETNSNTLDVVVSLTGTHIEGKGRTLEAAIERLHANLLSRLANLKRREPIAHKAVQG
jgi:ribosome-associated translation inhibitor RaiA